MIEFSSFEEISRVYPLDRKVNYRHEVVKQCTNAITKEDLDYCKKTFPNGYYSKVGFVWYHWSICTLPWYDSYIYDGEKWYLGIDTWDGIVPAEEPDWGVHYTGSTRRIEYGIFKTLEEAEAYRSKKIKELLDF